MEPLNLRKTKSATNLSQTAEYHSKKTNELAGTLKNSKTSENLVNKKQLLFVGHSCVWLPEQQTESGRNEHFKSSNSNSTNRIVEKPNQSISNVAKAEANELVSKRSDFAQQICTNKPVSDAKNAVKSNAEMTVKHEKKFIKSANGTLIRMKSQNSVEQSKNEISSKNIGSIGNSSKANESYVVPQHSNGTKACDTGKNLARDNKELKFFGHTALWMPKAVKPEVTISVPENKKNIVFLGHSCTWLPENSEKIPRDFLEKFGVEKPKVDVIEVKEKQSEAFAGKKDFKRNTKAANLKHDLSEKHLSSKPNLDVALNRQNNRDKNLNILKHGQPEVIASNNENKSKTEVKFLKLSNKIIDVESSNGLRKIVEKKNEDPIANKENKGVSVFPSDTSLPSNSVERQKPKQLANLMDKILAQDKINFLGRPVKYTPRSWKVLPRIGGIEDKKEDALLKPIEIKANIVPEKKIDKTEPSRIKTKHSADQNNLRQLNEKAKTDIGNKIEKQSSAARTDTLSNPQPELKQSVKVLSANYSNVQAGSKPDVKRGVLFIGHKVAWTNEINSNEPELKKAKYLPKVQAIEKTRDLNAIKAGKPEHKSETTLKRSKENKATPLKLKIDQTTSAFEFNELKVTENDFEFKNWLSDKTLKSTKKKAQAGPFKITESTAILDKEFNSINIIPKNITNSNTQSTLTKIPINNKLDNKKMNYNVVLDPELNNLKVVPTPISKIVQGKITEVEKTIEKKPVLEPEKLTKSVMSSISLPPKEQSLPTTFEVALGKLNDAAEKKDNLNAKAEAKNTKDIKNLSKPLGHHSGSASDPIKLAENPVKVDPSQPRATHEAEKAKLPDPKFKIIEANKKFPDSDKSKKLAANNVEKKGSTKLEENDSATVQNKREIEQSSKVETKTGGAILSQPRTNVEPKAGGEILKANKNPKSASQAQPNIDGKNVNQAANLEPKKSKDFAEKKVAPQKTDENKIGEKITVKQEEGKTSGKTKFEATLSGAETPKIDGTKTKSVKEIIKTFADKSSTVKLEEPAKAVKPLQPEQSKEGEKINVESAFKKVDVKKASDQSVSKNKIELPAETSAKKDSTRVTENKGFILIDSKETTKSVKPKNAYNFVRPEKAIPKNTPIKMDPIRTDSKNSNGLKRSISDHVNAEQTQKIRTEFSAAKMARIDPKIKEKTSAGVLGKPSDKIETKKDNLNKNKPDVAEKSSAMKGDHLISHYKKQVQQAQNEINEIIKKMESIDKQAEPKATTKIINENQTNAKKRAEQPNPNSSKITESTPTGPISLKKLEQLSNKNIQPYKSGVIEKKYVLASKVSSNIVADNKNKIIDSVKGKNSDRIIQQSAYAITSVVREKLNETALNLQVLDSAIKPKLDIPKNIFDVSKQQDKINQAPGTKSFTVNATNANKIPKKVRFEEPEIVKSMPNLKATEILYENNPLERVYKRFDSKLKKAEDFIHEKDSNSKGVQKAYKAPTMKCTLSKEQLTEIYLARKENDKLFAKAVPVELASPIIPIKQAPQETVADPAAIKNVLKDDAIRKPSEKQRNAYIPFSFQIAQSARKPAQVKIDNTAQGKDSSNSVLNKYKDYFKQSEDSVSVEKEKSTSIFHEIKNMIKEDLFTHSAAASSATAANVTTKAQIVENFGKEKSHEKVSVKEKKSENDELQLSEESCASQPHIDGKMKPLTIFQEIRNMIKEDIFSVPNQSPLNSQNIVSVESSHQVKKDSVKSAAKNIVEIKEIPEIQSTASRPKEPEIKINQVHEMRIAQKIDPVLKDEIEPVKLEKDEITVKITNHFKPKALKPLPPNASKPTEGITDKNEKSLAPNLWSIAEKETPKVISVATDASTEISKIMSQEKTVEHPKVEQSIQPRPQTLMEQIKYLFRVNKAPKSEQEIKNETQELMALLQIEKEKSMSPKSKPKIIQEDSIKSESEKLLEPLKDDTFKPIKSNESVILSTAQKNYTNYSESPTHKLLDKNSIEFERAKLLNIPKEDHEPKASTSTHSRRGSLDLNKIKELKISDAPPSPIIDRINKSISNDKMKGSDQMAPPMENASQNASYDVQKIEINSKNLKQDTNLKKFDKETEKFPTNGKPEKPKKNDFPSVNNNEKVLNQNQNNLNENLSENLGANKETFGEHQSLGNAPIAASVLNHLTNMNTEQSKIDQNIRLFTETEPKLDSKRISGSQAKSQNSRNENTELIASKDDRRFASKTDVNEASHLKKQSTLATSSTPNKKAEEIISNSNDTPDSPDSPKNKNDIETNSSSDENKKSSIVNFSRKTETNNSLDYGAGSSAINFERNYYEAFDPFTKNQILVKILSALKLAKIKKD